MHLHGLYQRKSIRELRSNQNTSDLEHSAELNELENRVEYLSLVCMAMAETFAELGFDQEKLAKKIEEIDLRDGKLDGKYVEILTCPSCNRKSTVKKKNCMYCGALLLKTAAV